MSSLPAKVLLAPMSFEKLSIDSGPFLEAKTFAFLLMRFALSDFLSLKD